MISLALSDYAYRQNGSPTGRNFAIRHQSLPLTGTTVFIYILLYRLLWSFVLSIKSPPAGHDTLNFS